jgi:hypothetical protein
MSVSAEAMDATPTMVASSPSMLQAVTGPLTEQMIQDDVPAG